MATHDNLFLIAGDDWQIDALLNDAAGQPLAITDPAQVEWTLLDSSHYDALPSANSSIVLGSNPGEVSVVIAAAVSTTLIGGTYHDTFRVTLNGLVQTPLQGCVLIQFDPFGATTVRPTGQRSRSQVAAVRTAEWAYHQEARNGG